MSNKQQSTSTPQAKAPRKIPPPLKCTQVDATRVSYTDLDTDNERSKAQMISFVKYDHDGYPGSNNLVFQTDWITVSQYGLPPIGEFTETDAKRTFIKVPLDPSQPACVELQNMLAGIDEETQKKSSTIFASLALEKKVSPAKVAKQFMYQPIVREPQDKDDFDNLADDEDAGDDDVPKKKAGGKKGKDKDKEEQEKFKYCKMKFDITYPDKLIKSNVFIRNEGPDVAKEDRTKECTAETATDLENLGMRWGCKIRMIVMANKLWAMKNKNDSGQRKYGVGLKIMQLEVVPRVQSASMKDKYATYAFVSEGEESDEETQATSETKPVSSKATKTSKASTKKVEAEVEDDEEEEDDDDEDDAEEAEEEEEEEDEEEDESDEEPPPVKSKSKPEKAAKGKSGRPAKAAR